MLLKHVSLPCVLMVIILFVGFFISSPVKALDCSLAKSATEKAICASAILLKIDSDLNKAYQIALATQPATRDEIKKAQRSWVKENETICLGVVECLQKRYEERINTLTMASKTAVNGSLRYTTVSIKKKKPYELDLDYPVFKGNPAVNAKNLNQWIKKQLESCDVGGERRYIKEELTLLFLNDNVAIIRKNFDGYCDGAYPNHSAQDYYVDNATGQDVDLWVAMPEDGQKAILKRIVDGAKNLPADDECKPLYAEDSFNGPLQFQYKGLQSFTVFASFPHATQACDDHSITEISPQALEKFYPIGSLARSLLKELH